MDLTTPQQGAFDSSFRFSDFYVWAMQQAFTGALDVNTRFGVRSIGFREGSPIWVEGVAEDSDRLGALLVSQGHAAAPDVDAALRVKAASPELLSEPEASPLTGLLLKHLGVVDDRALENALRAQTSQRMVRQFAIGEASWRTQPGSNEKTYTTGCPVEGRSVVITGLKRHAPDSELDAVAAALSEWGLKLTGSREDAVALGADPEDIKIIDLLDQPRSLSALEQHGNARSVRAVVRALMLFQMVSAVPLSETVPIAAPTGGSGTLPPPAGALPPPGSPPPANANAGGGSDVFRLMDPPDW